MASKPACFGSHRVWELWLVSKGACEMRERHIIHCRDCMPAYQLRMKKIGRCEHPEIMFTFEEGAAVGIAWDAITTR